MKLGFAGVERGIYEAIRKEVVRLGYLPDIRLFQPNDFAGYESAKQTIRDAGKKIIEVLGVGDVKARMQLDYNRILINRDDISKGTLGFYGTKSYDVVNVSGIDYYDVYRNASGTVDLQYQIEFITDDTIYDRLIQTIIMNVLGSSKGYLKGVNDDGTYSTSGFNVNYMTTLNKSGSEFIERALRYDIPDVIIEDRMFLYRTRKIEEIDILQDPGGNV